MTEEPPPFERTVCACKACVDCCKRQPGPLAPGDFERIAAFLGESPEVAAQHFWASPGALVRDGSSGKVTRIGSVTPRYDRRKKRCVFLNDDDRCMIHPVSPAGCALVDTHQSPSEAHERCLWLALRQQGSAEYQQLRRSLPYATHHKPTLTGL